MRLTSSPAPAAPCRLDRFTRLLISLGVLAPLICAGCDKKKTTPPPPTAGGGTPATPAPPPATQGGPVKEISENPAVLYDGSVPPTQLMLYGVKIGDAKSTLPAADVGVEADASGWVDFRKKENVFRIDEHGNVAAMALSDPEVLERLGVHNEQELIAKFGTPTQKLEAGAASPKVGYLFRDRGLTVWLDRQAGKTTQVIVGE